MRELLHRLAQRQDRASHLEHLALEQVDPLGVAGAFGREHRRLHLVDVDLDLIGDRFVPVDDRVADRPQYGGRPVTEDRRALLQLLPGRGQLTTFAVPDGDDVPIADEDTELPGLDRVALVDVPEGAQYDDDRIAEALDLGALVGLERILDGELVQVEEPLDPAHLGV